MSPRIIYSGDGSLLMNDSKNLLGKEGSIWQSTNTRTLDSTESLCLAARLSRKWQTSVPWMPRSARMGSSRKLSNPETATKWSRLGSLAARSEHVGSDLLFGDSGRLLFMIFDIMLTAIYIYDKIILCENSRMCRQTIGGTTWTISMVLPSQSY